MNAHQFDTEDPNPMDCWCTSCSMAEQLGLVHGIINNTPVVLAITEKQWSQLMDEEEEQGEVYFVGKSNAYLFPDGRILITDCWPPVIH